MYKVSVITPTYNRQSFLNQAIESFLMQDYENKEMIVVNDGGTIPIVPEGVTLYNIEHGNQAMAQSYGIEKSTGDLICTLDDDDLLMPNSLTDRVNAFDDNTDVVWTGAIDIWEGGNFKANHPVVVKQDIWNQDRIFINSMMYRKSIIDKIGYWFDSDLTSNEDWDFKIRCLKLCNCKPLDIFSIKHRCHDGMRSTAHRKTGELEKNETLMKNKLKEFFNGRKSQ